MKAMVAVTCTDHDGVAANNAPGRVRSGYYARMRPDSLSTLAASDCCGRLSPPLAAPYRTAKVTGALLHTQGGVSVDSAGAEHRPGAARPCPICSPGVGRPVVSPDQAPGGISLATDSRQRPYSGGLSASLPPS